MNHMNPFSFRPKADTGEVLRMPIDRMLERIPNELKEKIITLRTGLMFGDFHPQDHALRTEIVRDIDAWLQKSNLNIEGGGESLFKALWESSDMSVSETPSQLPAVGNGVDRNSQRKAA